MTDDLSKDCKVCGGWGVVVLEGQTHLGIPVTEPCKCRLAADTIRNLERGWKGVAYAQKLDSSPLLDFVNRDAYITASDEILRSHLKYVGVRQGRNWSFLVTSDADLMKAWLYNLKEEGAEIYDREIADRLANVSASASKRSLEDLVDPPGLLIIRLGVKVARNAAMSEVFLEAILRRDHENRPTWVVDQPGHRLTEVDALGQIHRSFSEPVEEHISRWPYFALGSQVAAPSGVELIGGMTLASTEDAPSPIPPSKGMALSFVSTTKTATQKVAARPADKKAKGRT